MAQFSFDIPDSLTRQLDALGDIDNIAPKMIRAGFPIVEKELTRRSAFHKRTGEMIASIEATEPRKTENGHIGIVRPTGKDSKGVRNMEKMAYLEYGTSHQKSTPVITPTIVATEDEVAEAMQEVFDEEVWIDSWNK